MTSFTCETQKDAEEHPTVVEATKRGIITFIGPRVKYNLAQERSEDWRDPEEWVRAFSVAWLVIERGYPANRLRLEVNVPRRTPNDRADIVVYKDDACREYYLVVECKASEQTARERAQGIEQTFGNANSLRVPFALYDEGNESSFFDVASFPQDERTANRLGDREAVPKQYGDVSSYAYIAGDPTNDIKPVAAAPLEARIRRAHSLIWAGGRRDPLMAFDEWSKLLFAKVTDERTTPTGEPRKFQIGTKETTATVANRIHELFSHACQTDETIFRPGSRIQLPDSKVAEVVKALQAISFTNTDIDTIGRAFEQFFGSIFRGGLGQYFTMRQLARFSVAMLDITHRDFVLDPTAGSGGFLLEALLQVWHGIEEDFRGQPAAHIQRMRFDFALHQVYGIEIHEILARICKINLLLHHDGHTNIEANRSCLDLTFQNPRLSPPVERFTCVVGNPPFGTEVKAGDEEQLGANRLDSFDVAEGLRKVASEQVVIERSIELLEPCGRFGLIIPDGTLNNQGGRSNCPRTRDLIATNGRILAIISLPDYAFRKSGAQNKTSILFFQKFTQAEKRRFDRELARLEDAGVPRGEAIARVMDTPGFAYRVFLGEANHVGYTPSGIASTHNDLYRSGDNGALHADQGGTILHEWRTFKANPFGYGGSVMPDCMAVLFSELWRAHPSRRLDPKYHLFKREEMRTAPNGWVRARIGEIMLQREDKVDFHTDPDRIFKVMTIGQNGEIRHREAGKGKNFPEWRAAYFQESPGDWYAAEINDVVFSSIDLWKGCIAIVPEEFDGAIVSSEFPIYEVIDERLSPEFLQMLLRSRYYQRAFRAITTGHSNRRRTQVPDFEALEIAFPPDRAEQERLIAEAVTARKSHKEAGETLRKFLLAFSNVIDGRGDEELPEIEDNGEDGGGGTDED